MSSSSHAPLSADGFEMGEFVGRAVTTLPPAQRAPLNLYVLHQPGWRPTCARADLRMTSVGAVITSRMR